MSDLERPPLPEAEILKKYPASSFIEGAYKDIQKATYTELEALKKKYEKAVKDHEQSVSENRTTMFSDLLSEVEARRKTLPAPETRTKKIQLLRNVVEGGNKKMITVDNRKILQDFIERRKEVMTPIGIDLAADIINDPFWKSLEAYMFRVNSVEVEKYYLCVQVKGDNKWLCVVEFSQEEYDKRISKEVPVNDYARKNYRVGRTYGYGDEIRIGI